MGSFSYTSRAGLPFFKFILLFYLGSFTYTPSARFIFLWGVSLTHLTLASVLSGEFLVQSPFWLYFYVGSFSSTSLDGFIFLSGVSLTRPMLALFFVLIWAVSLTHPMLASFFFFFFFFLSGEFLLHIPCWLYFFLSGAWFLCGEFLLHIPYWIHFYLGSFSYTSSAGVLFIWGVSPISREFLLRIPCFLYSSSGISLTHFKSATFYSLILGVSLTHPILAYFLSVEFLLHVPSWLFYFIFYSGEFLLHIPCWLDLYLRSFIYTPSARFIFLWGVSLTHPALASFLSE